MSSPLRTSLQGRHPVGLILVASLHVAFLWALVVGLRIHPSRPSPDSVIVNFFAPQPAKPLPPPQTVQPTRLAPTLTTVLPEVRIPEDPVLAPIQPSSTVSPNDVGTDLAAHQAVLTAAAIDPRSPLTQPPYPAAALRQGVEGTLAMEVLVGLDGRVRDARVVHTSGSALLDQAAMDEARRHWKLRPAMRDGVPFEQWYTLRVVFHLLDR